MPTAEETSILELPSGAPVMHVVQTARDEDGDILEVSESIWPADRVMLIDDYPIEQEPEQPSVASEVQQMLDPHTKHATELRNHWYWRPGHRPGRPFYTWHLTFEGQHDLHRLVAEYDDVLRDLPSLDVVPIPWLHITMQGIGFVDEVSDTDRDAIITAASWRLAKIAAPTLSFHYITIRPEAITLYPNPTEPVRGIRSEIREAIADVWGTNHVPETAENYQPHLSVGYVNSHVESSRVVEALVATNPDPARLVLKSASCIAIQRVNHSYHWDTYATAYLGS